MLGKLRGVVPLAIAGALSLGTAAQADDAYVIPSLVRLKTGADLKPVIDRVFEAGWDVVARGKGWVDVLVPQTEALNGLTGLGFAEGDLLGVEIRRENADDELAVFKGREDAGAYHTYAEVQAEIDAYVAAKPEMIRKEVIGTTVEGREIIAVEISGPGDKSDRPAMLVTGLHHSREWISVEVPMALIKTMVEGYGSEAWVDEIVDNRRLWVIPVVNPDGHFYSQTQHKMWRKNRAHNHDGTRGVDPNRNYGYNWGLPGASPSPGSETYRGPGAFSEPEIQTVRDLALREGFIAAISFHSYSELVLWPWGYTYDPAPDDDILALHGNKMAELTGYVPQQSSDLYPTSGDFTDWFYGDQGTLAYTFELGKQFVPPENEIPGIVSDNLAALRYFLENCADPFPLMTHRARGATTDTAGPYGVDVKITKRYQATSPLHSGEVVYRLPGAAEWARAPMTKADAGTWSGQVPGAAGYGDVEYYFEMREAPEDEDTPGALHRLPAEAGGYSFPVVEQLYLLVDDDAGKNTEGKYKAALDAAGLAYQVRESAGLTAADMLGATAVIWSCGADSSNALTVQEQALLKEYLGAGGELAIFGQDVAYDIKQSEFLGTWFKTQFVADKAKKSGITGAATGPLAGFTGTFGAGDGAKQRYPEVLAPIGGGEAVFTYGDGSEVGGVSYAGDYRVALYGIGLEGVDTAAARADVIGRVITWLGADGATRKARRARVLAARGDAAPGALHRLRAEVVDAARGLAATKNRAGLELLISAAGEEFRKPLTRAYLQAEGTSANK